VKDTVGKLIFLRWPRRGHKVCTSLPLQDLHQSTVEECERQPEARRGGDERQVEARTEAASATERLAQEDERQPEACEDDERMAQAGERQPEAREEDDRPVQQARDFDERQPEASEAGRSQPEADDRHPDVRGVDEQTIQARQNERQVANLVGDVRAKLVEEPLPLLLR